MTNLGSLEEAIKSYQKRFGIEEMFRDLKSGGYNLEGTNLEAERLSKLLIVTAIAHTSAILQGQMVKGKGIQKYVVRPESKRTNFCCQRLATIEKEQRSPTTRKSIRTKFTNLCLPSVRQ